MTVTERLMAPGQWQVNLRPDTPLSVRAKIREFGHVLITSTWVDPNSITDFDMKVLARYAGIVRKTHWSTTGQHNISGPGLPAWLGDENGKGRIFTSSDPHTYDLPTWIAYLATPLSSAVSGYTAATLAWDAVGLTPRAGVDYVCAMFGFEWRMSTLGQLVVAPAATLFSASPDDVIMRRAGAGNLEINGVEAGELFTEIDATSYVSAVTVLGPGEGTATSQGSASSVSPYLDYNGNNVLIREMVSAPSNSSAPADLNTAAAAQLARNSTIQPRISITSTTYDVGRFVAPGDWVYIFDPDIGLTDPSGPEVQLRDGYGQPMTLRCFAITWPVERGMGVFYRDLNGVYTDLTDFVVWEATSTKPTPTIWEVGAESPPFLPVATGVAAAYTPATERMTRPLGAGHAYGAAATSSISLTTTPTAAPGASITFNAAAAGTQVFVVGTFDFECNPLGFLIAVGELQVDGFTMSGQAVYEPSTIARETVSQSWVITLATAGSHTFRLVGWKAVAGGGVTLGITHTNISILVLE